MNGVPANEPGTASDVVPREVPAVAPEALEALRRAQSPRQPKNECDPLILLALEAGVPAATAEKVLKRIQRFDPIRCGARDLRECLWVQANHYVMAAEGKAPPPPELSPHIVPPHLTTT